MATEEILMKACLNGGDRQKLHEAIRVHSMEVSKRVKFEGKDNDLVERIADDEQFNLSVEDIEKILNPSNLCGRASKQTEEYINDVVKPILEKNKKYLDCIEKDVRV